MSVMAVALKHLIAAGVTGDALCAAIAEMEQAIDTRSTAAKRQARYRGRRNEASQNVTRDDSVTPPLAPSSSFPPDPLSNSTPIPGNTPRPRKGTRISEAWKPDPVTGQAAEMIAVWPPGTVERELAKFSNYWLAKSGRDAAKTDWQRTWINWLMSADERIPKHGQQHHRVSPSASNSSDGLGRTGRAALAARELLRNQGYG